MQIKQPQGFSIAIEGVDGSGKHTAAVKLSEILTELGKNCEVISFPQHDTSQGLLVDEFLYKGLRFSGNDIERAQREGLLYSIDRMVTMTAMNEQKYSKLDEYRLGKLFIFDRYLTSNFMHRCNEMAEEDLCKYMELMEIIEYDVMGIPKPNLVFILKTKPQVALENIEKRGREKDENETLENIEKSFNKISKLCELKNYIPIECCEQNLEGKWVMRSVEGIVADMLPYITEALKNQNELNK